MPALTGYAPTDRLIQMYLGSDGATRAPTAAYGTQTAPLDAFYSATGATGNKTTNKDLPAWLRAIGMKGDAYAGGMLKPEIRYGFAYKHGKIYFADGTSFAAKKNKGGTYSYTDGSGQQVSYNPTDEQNAYNKKYKASTGNQSVLDKATNAVKFELDHGKQIISHIKPSQVFFGIDPLGTKIGNAVTGSHATAQVDQLGGALPGRYDEYTARTGNATGYAKPLQGVAHVVAGVMGGQGAANGLGNLAGSVGSGGTGQGLGIFSNNGAQGLSQVGGGNAGVLAGSGAIGGGAGIGGTTAGALGSASGAANTVSGVGNGMPGASGTWTDWIGPAITAGSALYGQRQANNATDAATRASNAEQARQFDLVRSDTAPQRALGAAAIGRLAAVNGYTSDTGTPDMSQFFTSPDYQFNLTEGQNAIDRSAAARGGLLSGAAVKEGTRYASGMASREYGAFVDRLMQQAGLGSTGIGASAAAGANAANNISAATLNAGNARASGYMDTAANVSNAANQGYSNYMLRRYLGG
jgi:hypothetical protein